ncbi:Galactoside transport system permease protein mglC [Serratia entomophila]|nr:Galactoside transport system permease protein mglC [Serratia entomophila]
MNALNKKTLFTYFKEGGIYVVLLVLLAIIIIQDPTFLSLMNLSNILTQSSVRIIIALGVAGLIVTQGTDLSAGRQVGLAAVVAATLLQSMDNVNKVFPHMETWSIPLVILLVCAVGAVIGLVNGLIIAYLNVTPFITTLGTMIIVYGINSLYYDSVGASPVAGFDPKFSTFAQGFLRFGDFKLSYITFYAVIAILFVWILWNKTRFGKNIFAIGGNPEAAKVSGVNVPLNLIMIYALSGVFYAFGGLLEAGRIGSATNNLGFMYELDAIAACVVGGRVLRRRGGYGAGGGDRGDYLHRHQLRADLYRHQPLLAVHYQGQHHHLRGGAGLAEVRQEEVSRLVKSTTASIAGRFYWYSCNVRAVWPSAFLPPACAPAPPTAPAIPPDSPGRLPARCAWRRWGSAGRGSAARA